MALLSEVPCDHSSAVRTSTDQPPAASSSAKLDGSPVDSFIWGSRKKTHTLDDFLLTFYSVSLFYSTSLLVYFSLILDVSLPIDFIIFPYSLYAPANLSSNIKITMCLQSVFQVNTMNTSKIKRDLHIPYMITHYAYYR